MQDFEWERYYFIFDAMIWVIPLLIFLGILFQIILFLTIGLFPEVSEGSTLPRKRVFRFGKYYRGLK